MPGHPTATWLASPDFWWHVIHPEDCDAVASARAAATAAGRDHDLTYRAVTADGRVVWLRDLVHVVLGEDGDAAELQGVMIDITERKNAERASVLLAESGRLAADPEPVAEKLAALARLSVGVFGDYCGVLMLGDDGLLHRVSVARADAALRAAAAELPPSRIPDALADAFAGGKPFVVPSLTDEAGCVLVVPLVAQGQVLGTLRLVHAVGYPPEVIDPHKCHRARRRAAHRGLCPDRAARLAA